MNKKYLFHLIAFLCFQSVESQPYLELLQDGETSLEKIELVADRYFKKVGTDNNDYKFYQRWLYGAKMEACNTCCKCSSMSIKAMHQSPSVKQRI